MDTSRGVLSLDTIIRDSINGRVNESKFIACQCETSKKDFCNCKFASDLIWPIFFLIIVIAYYNSIRGLIKSVRTLTIEIFGNKFSFSQNLESSEANKEKEIKSKMDNEKIKKEIETLDKELKDKISTTVNKELYEKTIAICNEIDSLIVAFGKEHKMYGNISEIVYQLKSKNIINESDFGLLLEYANSRNLFFTFRGKNVVINDLIDFHNYCLRIKRVIKITIILSQE